MKIFKIVKWQLQVEDIVWGYLPFKNILDRDKSKNKETAIKEMLFIYNYCDIRSDYIIVPEEQRAVVIKHDIGLKKSWCIDKTIEEAISFYKERSITPIGELYMASINAINGVKDYLATTKTLLNERDASGKPITKVGDITKALKDVKTIMRDLKAAEKEVLKEKENNEGKKKGQQSFGLFEDGL